MSMIFKDRFWLVHIPFVSMVKIFISGIIPSWTPFPPIHAKLCNPFELVCCIHLLCDKPFNLYLQIIYTCYSVAIIDFHFDIIMTLFCPTIKRDSVSLLKFPLLSHVKVISCTIFLIYCLKYPYRCFSTHFCFLDFVVFLFSLWLTLLLLAAFIILII